MTTLWSTAEPCVCSVQRRSGSWWPWGSLSLCVADSGFFSQVNNSGVFKAKCDFWSRRRNRGLGLNSVCMVVIHPWILPVIFLAETSEPDFIICGTSVRVSKASSLWCPSWSVWGLAAVISPLQMTWSPDIVLRILLRTNPLEGKCLLGPDFRNRLKQTVFISCSLAVALK